MRKITAFAAVALLFSLPVHAGAPVDYDPADSKCQIYDDTGINSMQAILNHADDVLPNVPPEESQFFSAETESLTRITDENVVNSRYATLETRTFYHVWKLKKDILKVRAALKNVSGADKTTAWTVYKKSQEAEKLRLAIDASRAIDSYVRDYTEFLTVQTYAPKALPITSKEYTNMYGGILTLQGDITDYMDCKLAKIMGRQTY